MPTITYTRESSDSHKRADRELAVDDPPIEKAMAAIVASEIKPTKEKEAKVDPDIS